MPLQTGMAVASLLWLSLLLPGQLQAQSPPSFNRDFDPYFRSYTDLFLRELLPESDWQWFKAQCVQESGPKLNPAAVSPAGAVGVCQLMPGTARDFGLDPAHRIVPKDNIRAGALTLRRCTTLFFPRQTRLDRLRLGWACYNAGGGHILRAQVKCGGALLWSEIAPCLPQVTGKHAAETIGYVRKIPEWYQRLRS